MNLFLPLLTFVALLFVTLTAFQITRTRSGAQARLAKRLESLGQPEREEAQSILQEKTYSDIPQLNTLLSKAKLTGYFDSLVMQAGFRLRAGAMLLWMLLIGMAGALLVFLWKGNAGMAAGAFVGCGPVAMLGFLRNRRRARRGALIRQLPDSLEMIRGALQAGYSLPQALEAVCEEVPDPIRGELKQVTEELRLGHPLRAAFQGLFDRTGIEDLRYFVVAVLINREIGGNLSEIIDVVASTIRERFKLAAQIRALTSQGRFSALVLSALSPILLVALTILNPDYLQPMYTTPTGRMALGYAAVSTMFGYWLMRKIVNIKIVRID